MLVDGIRGMLGLSPIYAPDSVRSFTDTERFACTIHPGWVPVNAPKTKAENSAFRCSR